MPGTNRAALSATAAAICLAGSLAGPLAAPAHAQSGEPIKIGVIAEVQSIAGVATPGGGVAGRAKRKRRTGHPSFRDAPLGADPE